MCTFQLLVIMLATFLWPAILRPTAIMRNFMPCFRRIACTGNQPRSHLQAPDAAAITAAPDALRCTDLHKLRSAVHHCERNLVS